MTNPHDAVLEEQRKTWDKFAPGWKKWDEHTMGFLRPVGDAILAAARLKDGSVVLDVAAGTGEPGLTAAGKVGKGNVIGTDLSEVMVRIAAENAKARRISNYEARVAHGGALEFSEGTFDAVLCRFGVMFFPDPAAGVKEMKRVLKPGARVSFSVWGPPERNPWASLIRKIVADRLALPTPPPDAPGIFRFGAPGSAKALAEAAGLKDIQVEAVDWAFTAASPEEHWSNMTEIAAPISGPLAKADAATVRSIRAAVLEAVSKFAGKDGVSMPAQAHVVSGAK